MTQGVFNSASGYFGSMVESYDSLIRRAVPRYDEMTSRLVEYLPAASTRVLELGCGTGNLSLKLAEKFPGALLVLVDGSAEMTNLTAGRLKAARLGRSGETNFLVERFEELEFPAGTFDLVVSSISLHHVEDKARLYRQIRSFMREGGFFVFADQLRGEPESNHLVNWYGWLEFCRQPGNCTAEEIQSLLDHAAAHDHYTPLSEHSSMLTTAGFGHVDCVWRNLMWTIVTAVAA
jgi:tRNA (cmo5U34)-methyltransferase